MESRIALAGVAALALVVAAFAAGRRCERWDAKTVSKDEAKELGISRQELQRSLDESSERAVKLAALRDSLCTPALKATMEKLSIVSQTDDKESTLFVDPVRWARMRFSRKEALARWACVCLFDGMDTSVRNGNTNLELGVYDFEEGFTSKE
jgi:hypothetical protein